jgi:hypothetical protein
VTPLATEAWPAVFGGLIPIVGLGAIGYLIWHAVKDDQNNPPKDEDDAQK